MDYKTTALLLDMESSVLPQEIEDIFSNNGTEPDYPEFTKPNKNKMAQSIQSEQISGTDTDGTYGQIRYWEQKDELVYLTVRSRHGKQFFHKYNGFAISAEIMERLDMMGVESIFIGAKDTGDVWEFFVSDYLTSETVSYQEKQYVTSLDESHSVWRDAFSQMF